MLKRNIVILGYDGASTFDLVGPSETFHSVQFVHGHTKIEPYQVIVGALSRRPFATGSGFRFVPTCHLDEIEEIDTLVIPGGCGLREPRCNRRIVAWIRTNASRIRRIVSLCTGIYGLAPTGLLDGRRVTTHWRFAADVAQKFPKIIVDADTVFVKDGPFYTSAGASAGIDMALALIEEDLGSELALATTRELIVYLKRPGGQQQYSQPLRFQTQADGQLGALIAWIDANLAEDLSVERLAARMCLCPRQVSRVFRKTLGMTPGAYVEHVRVTAAQRSLTGTDTRIDLLARSLGYRSPDTFARAFSRNVGISPTDYRGRFRQQGKGSPDPRPGARSFAADGSRIQAERNPRPRTEPRRRAGNSAP